MINTRHRTANTTLLSGFALLVLSFLAACNAPQADVPNSTPMPTDVVATPTETIVYLPTPPLTPVPTYDNVALVATAEAIASRLPTASPIPDVPPTIQTQYQEDDLLNRAFSTAIALNPPDPNDFPWEDFTPVPHPPWPTAITHKTPTGNGAGVLYDTRFTGPPCSYILDDNHWYGTVAGQKYHVCAGAEKEHPSQGVIMVERREADSGELTHYDTSVQEGKIRIVDVIGGVITLRSEEGTTLYFDLATRQWVSSGSPTVAPISSPLPSPSP